MSNVAHALIGKDEILKGYEDFPKHMTPIGSFTYLRTYSRFLEEYGRREVWKETVSRASHSHVSLAEMHLKKIGVPVDYKKLNEEQLLLAKNQYNLKQALSGRTLWVGGADNGVADKFPLANFNCSFTNIGDQEKKVESWEDLAELFYLLLVGTGVGFKVTPQMAKNLPAVRDNFDIAFDEYIPLPKGFRSDETRLGENARLVWDEEAREYIVNEEEDTVTIHVGDSKEGWVDALRKFFQVVTLEKFDYVRTIRFNFDSVRPAGERLKTFGGTASGHQPLLEMFELFEKVFKNTLDDSLEPLERVGDNHVQLRPIHIADMANGVGYNVVVGGVRRTAEIYLFSGDPGQMDYESMFMKFGINGIWGELAFKHLEKVKKSAQDNNIPLPSFFDSLMVKYYDVNYEDENGDFQKETFTDKDEAIAFAEEKGVENFFPFPYNNTRGHLNHRRMSNNSIAFHTKTPPLKRILDFIFLMMKGEGEPGFINLYEASRRRLLHMGITDPEIIEQYAYNLGLNPCAEILLFSKGVCNLTTVNVAGFVKDGKLDLEGLIEAQKLSARSGLRMTLVELELPKWNEVQQRDRLLGTSLTGWKDAMGMLGYNAKQEAKLLKLLGRTAREEADQYAKELRVNAPLLVTTVKPEGTLSIVFGAVSSGLHVAHSPNYFRRIRINAQDPLAKAVQQLPGWQVYAEVGTMGYNREEDLAKPEAIAQARTLVINFPVESGADKTKEETLVDEQFDTYFSFQENYTEHNTSNTIHIQDELGEWDRACERVYEGWDNFVGVSFLALDGGSYTLAPYQACTKEQYKELWESMADFDFEVLKQYDKPAEDDSSLEGMEACEGGICPLR